MHLCVASEVTLLGIINFTKSIGFVKGVNGVVISTEIRVEFVASEHANLMLLEVSGLLSPFAEVWYTFTVTAPGLSGLGFASFSRFGTSTLLT
jgi:hypothetical protein